MVKQYKLMNYPGRRYQGVFADCVGGLTNSMFGTVFGVLIDFPGKPSATLKAPAFGGDVQKTEPEYVNVWEKVRVLESVDGDDWQEKDTSAATQKKMYGIKIESESPIHVKLQCSEPGYKFYMFREPFIVNEELTKEQEKELRNTQKIASAEILVNVKKDAQRRLHEQYVRLKDVCPHDLTELLEVNFGLKASAIKDAQDLEAMHQVNQGLPEWPKQLNYDVLLEAKINAATGGNK